MVTDPGFLGRGRGHQLLSLEQKPIIWQDACQNCMKKKEIGPGEARVPSAMPWIR